MNDCHDDKGLFCSGSGSSKGRLGKAARFLTMRRTARYGAPSLTTKALRGRQRQARFRKGPLAKAATTVNEVSLAMKWSRDSLKGSGPKSRYGAKVQRARGTLRGAVGRLRFLGEGTTMNGFKTTFHKTNYRRDETGKRRISNQRAFSAARRISGNWTNRSKVNRAVATRSGRRISARAAIRSLGRGRRK